MADDYDPYAHRNRPGATGPVNTLINCVKGILGTGILALPEAYMHAGWLLGCVSTVLITVLITYGLHMLFRGMYVICKRDKIPEITYPQAFKEALLVGPECLRKFANVAPYLVNLFVILYQIGVCCVYLIFIVSNVKQVIDQNVKEEHHYSIEAYLILLLIPTLLLTYIKNLKLLAPVSNIGNWVTLAGLICIYVYIFKDFKIEMIKERTLFGSPQDFPLFLGTAMFSVLSIGSFLTVELNQERPEFFLGCYGILSLAIYITTTLNILTGVFGYLRYGELIEASVTLNLDITSPIAWVVRLFFSLAIYFSYPLQAYPVVEIVWEQYMLEYMETSEYPQLWDYIMRTIFVLITVLLAIAIPRLNLFISLFGAFCLSILGMVFPPLMDICLKYPDRYGRYNILLIKNILFIIFGIIGFSSGTYAAMRAIILSFMPDKSLEEMVSVAPDETS